MYSDEFLREGDFLMVRTVAGKDGRAIGRNTDGRAILFSRHSDLTKQVVPGQEVDCRFVCIALVHVNFTGLPCMPSNRKTF